VPHAQLSVPDAHVPLASQQPLGQLDGLHSEVGPHRWFDALQEAPNGAQSTHWKPPMPQAPTSSPVRQVPASSQQPPQVEGLHPLMSFTWS
jgi:hypothetical protein